MSKSIIQDNLGEWLASIGVVNQFTSSDLESGKTVISLIKAVFSDSKIQLQAGQSAIIRMTNWNNIIEQLKVLGIRISQEQKNKIVNGNHDLIFHIISKLREYHQKSQKQTQINISEVDPKKGLKDAESLLQFFILAIVKDFTLTPKQALSLLSNDAKYLAHILAKGLKGDFRPVDTLVTDFIKNLPKIQEFCKNRQNESFFLIGIKPALICKSDLVSENCLALVAGYLRSRDKPSRIAILSQHLISTLMLIARRHSHLNQKVALTILETTDYSAEALELMVAHTQKQDLNASLILFWNTFRDQNRIQQLIKYEIFQKLLQPVVLQLKDSDSVISSLHIILEITSTHMELVTSQQYRDILLTTFTDTSIQKQAENIVFLHQCFSLLSIAGHAKNPIAPSLFKILLNRFSNCNPKEAPIFVMLFTTLTKEFPAIPLNGVLQVIGSSGVIRQAQAELFRAILESGGQLKESLVIYNLASRALVQEQGAMGIVLGDLVLTVIKNFRTDELIIDMTVKLVKVCLALYYAKFKKLTEKRRSLSMKNRLDSDQILASLKMMEIQHFLQGVLSLGDQEINSNIEALLCFSYIQVADNNKEHAQPLEKLIRMLGDFQKLIAKYESEVRGQEEPKAKPKQASRYQMDADGLQLGSQLVKIPKRSSSSHPMSLSFVGVAADAHKGLEKYQRLHLRKVQADEAARQQLIQGQETESRLKKIYERKLAVQKGLLLPRVAQNLQYIFEFDSRSIQQDGLPSYIGQLQEERDVLGVAGTMKKYQKVLKVYFNLYCGHKMGGPHLKNFQQTSEKNNLIHTSQIAKLLRDHGLENFLSLKEITTLTRRITTRRPSRESDPQLLDFEGFLEFFVQMSFVMFSRPPRDMRGRPVSEMIEEAAGNLRLYAGENRINCQLFDEPEAFYTNEAQAVKVLNKKLRQNADYILPEGYKKIIQKRVAFQHRIYLQAMSPTYKTVFEVLDQILFVPFRFHLIEPFIRQERLCYARPNVYLLQRFRMHEAIEGYLPISLKREVSRFPMGERGIAKEAAGALAEIIQAIEMNHEQVGIRHENVVARGRKEKEQEARRQRQQEQKKRQAHDKQLKSLVQQLREKKESQKERQEKNRMEEKRKQKQEKQKRQKRERELKNRLQEFNQKKKEDEEKQKEEAVVRSQKQKQQAQRRKREFEDTKRKVEESKKRKEEEQKARKQQEKLQDRRRKEEEKKRFEESQKEKKQKIEEYKDKKKGEKAMDTNVPAPDS